MTRRHRSLRRRSGVAAVEMAAASVFVLSPLLVGLWEAARLVEVKQIVANAAREAGRQAASGQMTNAQVQQVGLNYLTYAGLSTSSASVTVSDLTNPGTDASAAAQLDQLQITVSIPFSAVRLVPLQLVTDSSTQVVGQAIWYSMRDKPYPNPPTAPSGS